MKRITPGVLVAAVILSLVIGGIAGFVLGIASTRAGKAFIRGMVEAEKNAEVTHPQKLVREKFELEYPSNWKIDAEDKDYDPDHMFSIDSPGNAFVMFVIGSGDTDPGDSLQSMIGRFEKVMSGPAIDRSESYGRLTGKGATMKGKILGIRTTVKLFAFSRDGLTIMITQQCPDEDLNRVQDGLALIERSFLLRTITDKRTPDQ